LSINPGLGKAKSLEGEAGGGSSRMSGYSVLEAWPAGQDTGKATPATGHHAACQHNEEKTWEVPRGA